MKGLIQCIVPMKRRKALKDVKPCIPTTAAEEEKPGILRSQLLPKEKQRLRKKKKRLLKGKSPLVSATLISA